LSHRRSDNHEETKEAQRDAPRESWTLTTEQCPHEMHPTFFSKLPKHGNGDAEKHIALAVLPRPVLKKSSEDFGFSFIGEFLELRTAFMSMIFLTILLRRVSVLRGNPKKISLFVHTQKAHFEYMVSFETLSSHMPEISMR
jgi:hypothetical protein